MAACKSAPSLKILFLGIAFLFSTLKNHRRLQCTLDERIAIQEFANGFGTEDLEALIVHKVFAKYNGIVHKVFAKYNGHRRFSMRRVRYYSNSVATFSFDLILLAGDVEVNPGMSNGMAFKCMTGLSPNYLSNKFISRGSISGRATRNSQKLNIPLCKSATGQRSFYYRIVSIWNTISPTLKLSQCVSSFKRNLKLDLLKEFLS